MVYLSGGRSEPRIMLLRHVRFCAWCARCLDSIDRDYRDRRKPRTTTYGTDCTLLMHKPLLLSLVFDTARTSFMLRMLRRMGITHASGHRFHRTRGSLKHRPSALRPQPWRSSPEARTTLYFWAASSSSFLTTTYKVCSDMTLFTATTYVTMHA
jgi:hypothetical protein